MTDKIMSPAHSEWNYFVEQLEEKLTEGSEASVVSGCDDTHKLTKEILDEFSVDIDETLEYLEDNGGYCDCEVIMNVDAGF